MFQVKGHSVGPPTSSATACSTSEVNRAPVTAFTWEEAHISLHLNLLARASVTKFSPTLDPMLVPRRPSMREWIYQTFLCILINLYAGLALWIHLWLFPDGHYDYSSSILSYGESYHPLVYVTALVFLTAEVFIILEITDIPAPVLVASGSEPRSGCTSALWWVGQFCWEQDKVWYPPPTLAGARPESDD